MLSTFNYPSLDPAIILTSLASSSSTRSAVFTNPSEIGFMCVGVSRTLRESGFPEETAMHSDIGGRTSIAPPRKNDPTSRRRRRDFVAKHPLEISLQYCYRPVRRIRASFVNPTNLVMQLRPSGTTYCMFFAEI